MSGGDGGAVDVIVVERRPRRRGEQSQAVEPEIWQPRASIGGVIVVVLGLVIAVDLTNELLHGRLWILLLRGVFMLVLAIVCVGMWLIVLPRALYLLYISRRELRDSGRDAALEGMQP